MPQEEIQPQTPHSDASPVGTRASAPLIGAVLLILLALGACIFVFSYLTPRAPAASQSAAAAQIPNPFDSIAIQGKAAIVVDLTTHEILYAKNSEAQLPLASITKVATVLAVSEVLSPDTVITIPYDTAPTQGGQRLHAGEKWKVRDVIHFTLIASSNEGAKILAAAADDAMRAKYPQAPEGGAVLWRMNEAAKELGLTSTYFVNVSGLDESATQAGAFGSARDIAQMLAYVATTMPDTYAGTARDGLLLVDEQGTQASAFNTNEALGKIPGLILGKTGYTDLAGGNLGVVFDVGLAHPVVAVVLGSSYEGRFTDMQILTETARKAIALH